MKNTPRKKRIVFLTLLIVAAMVSGVLGAELFTIMRWTVDGGGAQGLSGGAFTLSGTAGQPDAGKLTGGVFTLNAGFWHLSLPSGPTAARDWALYR